MTSETSAVNPADRGPLQGIPITGDSVVIAPPPPGAPPVDPMLIRGLRAAMSAQRPARRPVPQGKRS